MLRKGYLWFRISIVLLLIISLLSGGMPSIMLVSESQAATIAEEFPIFTEQVSKSYAQISGNYAIWLDYRNGNEGIYGYNLSTKEEFPICTNLGTQWRSQVSDNHVIWEDYRDNNGNGYAYIYGAKISIENQPAIVNAPPEVTRTEPSDGETGVVPGGDIRVYFSEKMNAATINASTVVLTDGVSNIPVALTYGNDPRYPNSLTIDPQITLLRGQTYTVKLTNDILSTEDPAQHLEPYSFSFKVSGANKERIVDALDELENAMILKMSQDTLLVNSAIDKASTALSRFSGYRLINTSLDTAFTIAKTVMSVRSSGGKMPEWVKPIEKAVEPAGLTIGLTNLSIDRYVLQKEFKELIRLNRDRRGDYFKAKLHFEKWQGTDGLKGYVHERLAEVKHNIPDELSPDFDASGFVGYVRSLTARISKSTTRADQRVDIAQWDSWHKKMEYTPFYLGG